MPNYDYMNVKLQIVIGTQFVNFDVLNMYSFNVSIAINKYASYTYL